MLPQCSGAYAYPRVRQRPVSDVTLRGATGHTTFPLSQTILVISRSPESLPHLLQHTRVRYHRYHHPCVVSHLASADPACDSTVVTEDNVPLHLTVPQQHIKDGNSSGNGQIPSVSPHQQDQHCHRTYIVESSQLAPRRMATYKTVRERHEGSSLPFSASCLSVWHIQPNRSIQPPCHQHRSIPIQ